MEGLQGKKQVKLENVNCAICGTGTASVLYTIDVSDHFPSSSHLAQPGSSARVVKCNTCGLVYVNPRWIFPDGLMPYTEDEEEKYFEATFPERKEAYARLLHRSLTWVNRPVQKALDLGCGDGVLLELCQKAGIPCEGLEVSPSLVEKLRKRYPDLAIHDEPLAELPSMQYDVVFLINVIEHLTDPVETIRQIHRILRPGGITLIHTPNAAGIPAILRGPNWHQIAPLVHLYYFSPATLKRALAKENLEFVDGFYIPSRSRWKQYLQLAEYKMGLQLDNGLGIVARRND